MRSAALTTVVAAAAVFLAACASTQTGTPSPAAQPSGSSSAPASSPLTGLNACSLLTDAEARQVVPGVQGHTDKGTIGGAGTSSCQWISPATNETGGFVLGIAVRPAQSIQDVSLNPEHPEATATKATTAGGRQAVVVRNNQGEGDCMLSIAVGAGRVDIDGQNGRATTEESCSKVSQLSDLVEPKLPAS